MNLVELFDERGIEYRPGGTHPHVCRGWVGVDCLSCSPDSHKFKLGIHLDTLACSCWTCGPVRLYDVLVSLSLGRHYKRLKDPADVAGRTSTNLRPSGKYLPPASVGPLRKAHVEYLKGRGFDPDGLASTWGIRGIGPDDQLPWRIFLPVGDRRGEPVSWTTRATHPGVSPRYSSAPPDKEAVPHKHLLYGRHLARGGCVVLVEGPFDALRVGPGACALFGTGYSRPQVLAASKYPVRAVCFDNSDEAQQRAEDLCSVLDLFDGRTLRVELDADDPGSASSDEVNKLRRALLE